MPIYFRRCPWKTGERECGRIIKSVRNHYCDKHRRDAHLKTKIALAYRNKKLNEEIRKMTPKDYEELRLSILKQLEEEDETVNNS